MALWTATSIGYLCIVVKYVEPRTTAKFIRNQVILYFELSWPSFQLGNKSKTSVCGGVARKVSCRRRGAVWCSWGEPAFCFLALPCTAPPNQSREQRLTVPWLVPKPRLERSVSVEQLGPGFDVCSRLVPADSKGPSNSKVVSNQKLADKRRRWRCYTALYRSRGELSVIHVCRALLQL